MTFTFSQHLPILLSTYSAHARSPGPFPSLNPEDDDGRARSNGRDPGVKEVESLTPAVMAVMNFRSILCGVLRSVVREEGGEWDLRGADLPAGRRGSLLFLNLNTSVTYAHRGRQIAAAAGREQAGRQSGRQRISTTFNYSTDRSDWRR